MIDFWHILGLLSYLSVGVVFGLCTEARGFWQWLACVTCGAIMVAIVLLVILFFILFP